MKGLNDSKTDELLTLLEEQQEENETLQAQILEARQTVSLLSSYEECRRSPYMAVREGGKTRLLVIAGDRGLAGGYNANIFRLMRDYADAEVIPVGKRACDRFGGDLRFAESFS